MIAVGPAIKRAIIVFLLLIPALLFAEPLYSPTWGFFLDLPEGYELSGGNNVDRYSFKGPQGAQFDMVVYNGTYPNIAQLAADVSRRLQNSGDTALFTYNGKTAALMELRFAGSSGWGLCLELEAVNVGTGANINNPPPLLVALSYAPEKAGMDLYHLSALDSFAPSSEEQRIPGPVMEFTWPRGEYTEAAIAGTNLKAQIREHDAQAAQAFIEREFALLRQYTNSPQWQSAWIRYYRMIYRDSCDRIADAAYRLASAWSGGPPRAFAEKALAFVQGFQYERNLDTSDFVNLVSAVTEGRGDCDSRAMLFAMLLSQANIPSAMMVSRDYSHAMGLADIPGAGARFEANGTKWLVAETTARVTLGLINQEVSNPAYWLAILFD